MSSFAKHHVELRKSVKSLKGKTLATSEIKQLFCEMYPKLDVAWVHPSDHCTNHTCKGACDCSLGKGAIFEKVKHGFYKVL